MIKIREGAEQPRFRSFRGQRAFGWNGERVASDAPDAALVGRYGLRAVDGIGVTDSVTIERHPESPRAQ